MGRRLEDSATPTAPPSHPPAPRIVENLGILTGPQLFSLNKEELKKVCGEEGSRVYSQLTVQKAFLEKQQSGSELEKLLNKIRRAEDSYTNQHTSPEAEGAPHL